MEAVQNKTVLMTEHRRFGPAIELKVPVNLALCPGVGGDTDEVGKFAPVVGEQECPIPGGQRKTDLTLESYHLSFARPFIGGVKSHRHRSIAAPSKCNRMLARRSLGPMLVA